MIWNVRGAALFTLVLVAAACEPTTRIYCTPDETMCHGSCSALYKDPQNCGACDAACGSALVCSQGACATSCGGGTTQCGSSCVETFIDCDNCGSCGHACGAGEVCSKGACGTTCSFAQKLCGANVAYCANIGTDNANCGDCGVHCGLLESCVGGQCVPACTSEQTLCDGMCANLKSDAAHCGSCAVACLLGQHCIDAVCACPQNLTTCGGACVDTSTDKNNCGACSQKCAGTCDGGRCTVVYNTPTATGALGQDSTRVFFADATGEVRQGSKAMVAFMGIGPNAFGGSLTVDSSNVYWPNGAAIEIAQIGGNGSSEQTVPNAANEVTTDGTWVYVADATGIRRFPSGGGTVGDLVSDANPHSLSTANGLIAWANGAYQVEVANADGTSQATVATMTSAIDHVATDGTNVYFTWSSNVLSVPVAASGPPFLLASGLTDLTGIATDGANVYWIDAASISRVPVGGGATTKIYASGGDVAQIVVDGSSVYWTSSAAKIGKVTPK